MDGVVRAAANRLPASRVWRAINPALAHGSEALSPGKRTLRSKSPVNIWYSKLH